MPIIKIWCLPDKQEEAILRLIHRQIVIAVTRIPELGLKTEMDMTVLFPPDMMKYGLGQEIIIEISGLFRLPGRTPAVIQKLAANVGCAVSVIYPKAKVECFVQQFDRFEGFWTSEEDTSIPL